MVLVQVYQFRSGTNYGLHILHRCRKKVKSNSQKVFGTSSYAFRSYRRKPGMGTFPPMLNKVKQTVSSQAVQKNFTRIFSKRVQWLGQLLERFRSSIPYNRCSYKIGKIHEKHRWRNWIRWKIFNKVAGCSPPPF